MEYALRQTLVADAVSLQFRLPPPGVPPPVSRRSPAIAHNTPVVDTLVITSVWAVHLLRTLSQVTAMLPDIACMLPRIYEFSRFLCNPCRQWSILDCPKEKMTVCSG